MALSIPAVSGELDIIGAAFAYANAGWYVGPTRRGDKSPGGVLGKGWQHQTSRDPEQIVAWFAGTDYGLFLHVGRSGAVVFDVDDYGRLPELLRKAFGESGAPFQSTRANDPNRGHYVFAVPDGRTLGNGVGRIGGGWGEIRGANGVIVAAPSHHEKPEGQYVWLSWGSVPTLPDYVAVCLGDASPAVDAATDAAVAAFLADHGTGDRWGLVDLLVGAFSRDVGRGESRHAMAVRACVGLMREAALGYYGAASAAGQLESAFISAVTVEGHGKQGSARSLNRARAEFQGILAWSVAQAMAQDSKRTHEQVQQAAEPALTFAPMGGEVPKVAESDVGNSPTSKAVRRVALTPVSAIEHKRVKWLWDGRIALGTLSLLAGREGLGKSTLAYQVAADASVGKLGGEFYGTPKPVLVCATEDSYEHTIGPRLLAAGADSRLIYRVQVVDQFEVAHGLTLPQDNAEVESKALALGACLLLLDPLTSRLGKLDSHKDAEVRQALEPLAAIADRVGMAVLGIMHHNKSGAKDPLNLVMASKAFTAVARSVHTVVEDPDDEGRGRIFGTPKNNLGRTDLPSLRFHIESFEYPTDDGPGSTGQLVWDGEIEESIAAIMERTEDATTRSATKEAKEWLAEHLKMQGGIDDRKSIMKAGRSEGYNPNAIERAAKQLKLEKHKTFEFPAKAMWALPGTQIDSPITFSGTDTQSD
jgi:hypothetical protein